MKPLPNAGMALLQTMASMTQYPLLATFPSLLLTGLYWWTKRRFILMVALCWAFYVPYEYGMKWRFLCSGECNIRVDLLLIYPALAVLSVISIGLAIRALFTITLTEI
jgi:hypothetical protein